MFTDEKKKKKKSPIQHLNFLTFYLIGPSLTHFISKYFATKWKSPISGKLLSMNSDGDCGMDRFCRLGTTFTFQEIQYQSIP